MKEIRNDGQSCLVCETSRDPLFGSAEVWFFQLHSCNSVVGINRSCRREAKSFGSLSPTGCYDGTPWIGI